MHNQIEIDSLITTIVDQTDFSYDELIGMSEHDLVMLQAEEGIIDSELAEEYGIDTAYVSYFAQPAVELKRKPNTHIRSQIRPFVG